MKNKLALLLGILMSASLLAACVSTSDVAETTVTTIAATTTAATEASTTAAAQASTTTAAQEPTTTLETTPAATEAPHEHKYTEAITTEATCDADGLKTFTCECGDTYTESITATGHIFENYISNNDATYLADGTETAKCNSCEMTDTRTAEGSMLAYTYIDMDATMYAQQTVNVRSMPSTESEKIGVLSTNDEVKVTGQCAETSWYRIEYSGSVAYVSDSYLGNDKIVVQTEASEQTDNSGAPNTIKSGAESAEYPNVLYVNVCVASVSYPGDYPIRSLGKCPYPIGVEIDNGDGTHTKYIIVNHGGWLNGAWVDFTSTPVRERPNGILPVDSYPYDEGCVHKFVY